jgi:hypothetical protein
MKKLFVIALFAFPSFGALIGDFAPTIVGSKWEYSYLYTETDIILLYSVTMTIQLQILSKQSRGDDTLVQLKINEKGIQTIYYDTITIDDSFVDTAIISKDSIYKASSYKCTVFPFWKSHFINSDSLSKGVSGQDTLFFLPSPPYDPHFTLYVDYNYLQGIGLDSYYSFDGVGRNVSHNTTIHLISYNDQGIALESKLVQRRAGADKIYPCNVTRIFRINNGKNFPDAVFLINGKRIGPREIVPSGVVITKGSAPVNRIIGR